MVKLRVLIYSLNFAPELTGIGKYSGEMAKWLAEQGHDVRVITAPPYYPEWKVRDDYSALRYSCEHSLGVRIIRCPVWIPKKVTGVRRLLHLASFALASMPALLSQVRWRPAVVWVVEPALFCAPGALALASLTSARSWLHIQDFEVDAAFSMGLLRGERLRSIVLRLEEWLMRRFDVVSSISRRMLMLAAKKGVPPDKLVKFPNWADLSAITVQRHENSFRAKLGIRRDAVVALYSGNMGAKQGLEVLAAAAHILQKDSNIKFIFCGDGAGKQDLARLCSGLTNVKMIPLQPIEYLNDLLAAADIHLLPQRSGAADLVLPSKLTGMLASGRPVIVTADPFTELAETVTSSGCGVVVPPEDPAALSTAIQGLAKSSSQRSTMGAAGRFYAERELDATNILRRFERALVNSVEIDKALCEDQSA